MPSTVNESLSLFGLCVALSLLGYAVRDQLPGLFNGPIGLLLVGGALFAAFRTLVICRQERMSLLLALLLLLLTASLAAMTTDVALRSILAPIVQHHPATTEVATSPALPTVEPVETIPMPTAPAPSPVPATPSPPPAVAATATNCGVAQIGGTTAVRIRAQPGTQAAVLAARRPGTMVELACEAAVEASGLTWQRIRSGTIDGWISARFLVGGGRPTP
jgi:hypothetical protein